APERRTSGACKAARRRRPVGFTLAAKRRTRNEVLLTIVAKLADFTCRAAWEDLSESARQQLLIRVLDSLACALGALGADPVERVAEHLRAVGGAETCTLIGLGRSAPDRAALWNGFLVRYLDFNDSYLAP